MNKTLFDTSLKNYEDRKKNVEKKLSPEFFEKITRDDIRKGKTMDESYSGWFAGRLAQYLIHSRDVDNPKDTDYPFYAKEADYYRTGIAKAIMLVPEVVDTFSAQEYEVEYYQDKEGYLGRLFDNNNITIEHLRNFVKLGFFKNIGNVAKYTLTDRVVQELYKFKSIIDLGCTKTTDKAFLNQFDGIRSVNEIAEFYGIRHQNVSKRLTRICKNALKKVRQ